MNIEGKTIWQQAAGDTNRNYIDVCLDRGVILQGPADGGPWNSREEFRKKYHWLETRKATDVQRFWEEMKDGDLVVLRLGTNAIYGVGEIVGDYEWCEEFNDVDGWNIGHVRRVRWLWDCRKYGDGQPQWFEKYALKFGGTTQLLTSDEAKAAKIKAWLETLDTPDASGGLEPGDLPDIGTSKEVSLDDVEQQLFDKGRSPESTGKLMKVMQELKQIARYYDTQGEGTSEYETITHLVVPLLGALGWTPLKMAIQWPIQRRKIDIALFPSTPREPKSFSVVVEAKKLRRSSLTAFPQARSYAQQGGDCNRIIVTDGLRYGVFSRQSGEFGRYPDAYLNLNRMRDSYPIYGDCKGAAEALFMMSTDWR